jgi:hypothetical protein
MDRVARLRELLKQKEAIDTELVGIKKQMNEESGLFKKPRKPREKKQADPPPAPVKVEAPKAAAVKA